MHWPSVLSYMISSFSIVIFNKIVLTIFEFNSVPFIMFCQSVFTIIVFILRKIPIKKPSLDLIKICTINISNVFFGISAAGALNVAMFSALRRLSIFMTLLGQWYYLKQKPSNGVIFSIFVMILGAIIAAGDDLSFNALGYGMVTINNFLTAYSQLEMKRGIELGWSKIDILFWSAIISFTVFGLQLFHFDFSSFSAWDNGAFRMAFACSITLGFIINWAISWTIEKNDALTLAVAGSTKSAIMGIIVCLGIFDKTYIFTWTNFTGLQISAIGSLIYVYYMHKNKPNVITTDIKENLEKMAEEDPNVRVSTDTQQATPV